MHPERTHCRSLFLADRYHAKGSEFAERLWATSIIGGQPIRIQPDMLFGRFGVIKTCFGHRIATILDAEACPLGPYDTVWAKFWHRLSNYLARPLASQAKAILSTQRCQPYQGGYRLSTGPSLS